MHTKIFDGQYSTEQILLDTHEHPVAFLLYHLWSFLAAAIFLFIGVLVLYFLSQSMVWVVLAVVLYGLWAIWYFFRHFRHTRFIITSRRVVLFISHGFYGARRQELRLDAITSIKATRSGIASRIFRYGNVIFSGGGEPIMMRGVKLHDEVRSYVGRIVEYIKNHWYPESFSIFRSRKERRALQADSALSDEDSENTI